jgi:hypothetical protein
MLSLCPAFSLEGILFEVSMPALKATEYFLKMELIALDERLCRTLDRTMRLCEQAEEYDDTQEVDRIRRVNKVLVSARRRLGRLC